jgi:RNA polymerase sigma factor (sigma-70 family)
MTDLASQFQAFLAGDDAAFATLYCEVNPRLSAYCHKLAPGHAEDLMQELWERLIAMRKKNSPSSEGGGGKDRPRSAGVVSPVAFLFRMLKNLAIDEHRRRKNEIALDDDRTDPTDLSDVTYIEQSTEIECIILEALEKLSAEEREVLVLNIYSGYNFGEIAEMLGCSPEAVWQRASRARVKLRKIVIEDAERLGVALPRMSRTNVAPAASPTMLASPVPLAAKKKEIIL